ncbi:hypothetical protein [Massilia sp. SYSU DXS3249]
MRPYTLLLPASLLLASSAFAQNQPYPPPEAPISTVQVSAVKPVLVMADEAETIQGEYKMSNGWRLKVATATRHIDAAIDKQKPMRLLAVAPYKFVSRDGNVTMDFNRGAYGDEMLMSYVPGPRMARVYLSSGPLIAQR